MKLFELAKIKTDPTESYCWETYLVDIQALRSLYKNPLILWILVEKSSPQELKEVLVQLSEIAKKDRTISKLVKTIKNFRRK